MRRDGREKVFISVFSLYALLFSKNLESVAHRYLEWDFKGGCTGSDGIGLSLSPFPFPLPRIYYKRAEEDFF